MPYIAGLLTVACPEGAAAVQDAIVAATAEEPSTSGEGLTGVCSPCASNHLHFLEASAGFVLIRYCIR